jgi:hypothetical protein
VTFPTNQTNSRLCGCHGPIRSRPRDRYLSGECLPICLWGCVSHLTHKGDHDAAHSQKPRWFADCAPKCRSWEGCGRVSRSSCGNPRGQGARMKSMIL